MRWECPPCHQISGHVCRHVWATRWSMVDPFQQRWGTLGSRRSTPFRVFVSRQASAHIIKTFCDSCPICARGKSHKGQLAIPSLQPVPTELTARPLDSLHLDFVDLGPCPNDPSVEALLTIVDAHSRFTWLLPCTGKREMAASTIARVEAIFKDHSPLSRIVTDNWPQFRQEWDTHWAARGVTTHHTAVGNPKGNGLVERANRTATSIIRLLLLDGGHHRWTQVVPAAQRAINWTTNSV